MKTSPVAGIIEMLGDAFGVQDILDERAARNDERSRQEDKARRIHNVVRNVPAVPRMPDPERPRRRWALFYFPLILAGFFLAIGWITSSGWIAGIGLAGSLLGMLLNIYVDYRQRCVDSSFRREMFSFADKHVHAIRIIDYAPHLGSQIRQQIKLLAAYVQSGYRIEHFVHGFGCWSPAVSEWLLNAKASLSVAQSRFSCPERMFSEVGARIEVNQMLQSKSYHNQDKIRLTSDLVAPAGAGWPTVIHLQKTDYLSNLCTNDLAFKEVIDSRSRQSFYNGADYFLENDATGTPIFRGLADSECSNQLGISTLAFTSDGYLILIDQTEANIHSSGLIAPSGSGSLDWSDLPADPAGLDFYNWLSQVSMRELKEEIGIDEDASNISEHGRARFSAMKINRVPVGFGCYLHRGGKPEFFFLAVIGCAWDELKEIREYSSQEKLLSKPLEATQKFGIGLSANSAAEGINRVIASLRKAEGRRLSFPLELQLAMVENLTAKHPAKVADLFKF